MNVIVRSGFAGGWVHVAFKRVVIGDGAVWTGALVTAYGDGAVWTAALVNCAQTDRPERWLQKRKAPATAKKVFIIALQFEKIVFGAA